MSETPPPHPDRDEQDDSDAVWVEPTSDSEFIAAAFNAISAVQSIDTALMPEQYEKMRRRVIRRSLRIIDQAVDNLYDEMFVLNGDSD